MITGYETRIYWDAIKGELVETEDRLVGEEPDLTQDEAIDDMDGIVDYYTQEGYAKGLRFALDLFNREESDELLAALGVALTADECPCCGRDNTGHDRCTSDDCPGVQAIAKATVVLRSYWKEKSCE